MIPTLLNLVLVLLPLIVVRGVYERKLSGMKTKEHKIMPSSLNISSNCDILNIKGYWKYGASESTDNLKCKAESDFFEKHMNNYECRSYQSAVFVPTSACSLLTNEESLNILRHNLRPGAFAFVGDSLMVQQYVAAQCDYQVSMSQRTMLGFRFHFDWDSFLRPNIPCEVICLQNSTFRISTKDHFPDRCAGCPEGKVVSSTPPHYSTFQKLDNSKNSTKKIWWMQRLPSDTRILVIGTGAWYNKFQGILHGSEEYRKTLTLLRPIFKHLISRGVLIIWLALPPLVDDIGEKTDKFEWDKFSESNSQARKSFEALGVIYLDIRIALQERKLHDPNISVDGLHWCNVGRTAVPTFINKMIFHEAALVSEKLLSSKHHLKHVHAKG